MSRTESIRRDMMSLKLDLALEKQKIESKIADTDKKIVTLLKIAEEKKRLKGQPTRFTSQPPPNSVATTNGIPTEAYEIYRTTMIKEGVSVQDFCTGLKTVKALPRERHVPSNDVEPTPITNKNILRIRNDMAKKMYGDKTIKQYVKTKEIKAKMQEEKERKKIKIFPNIKIPTSMLPNRYDRGELPCTIEHGINGHYLSWACPLDQLDYDYYLPIFFDGLQCSANPAKFLARQGIEDMLIASKGYPERVLPCLPKVVRPLRNALNKFDIDILLGVLKAVQLLVNSNKSVGPTLMKLGKQFLAPMAAFLDNNRNIGDSIDYGQRWSNDVGEEVRKTLELMEENGGPNAFELIKFSIPLYQSCVRKPDAHHTKK